MTGLHEYVDPDLEQVGWKDGSVASGWREVCWRRREEGG